MIHALGLLAIVVFLLSRPSQTLLGLALLAVWAVMKWFIVLAGFIFVISLG